MERPERESQILGTKRPSLPGSERVATSPAKDRPEVAVGFSGASGPQTAEKRLKPEGPRRREPAQVAQGAVQAQCGDIQSSPGSPVHMAAARAAVSVVYVVPWPPHLFS